MICRCKNSFLRRKINNGSPELNFRVIHNLTAKILNRKKLSPIFLHACNQHKNKDICILTKNSALPPPWINHHGNLYPIKLPFRLIDLVFSSKWCQKLKIETLWNKWYRKLKDKWVRNVKVSPWMSQVIHRMSIISNPIMPWELSALEALWREIKREHLE